MKPYLILISVIIIEGLMYQISGKTKRSKKTFIRVACIELILFAGFRSLNIGADTKNYLYALNYFKSFSVKEIFTMRNPWNVDYEVGYMLLTKIAASVRMSESLFLFLIAGLIYVPVFIYIQEESEDVVFSTIIYICFELFTHSLGIFRQMISVSIILLGFKYIKNRNYIKYFVFVIIAMSFHMSAIIAVPIYFTYHINIKKHYVIVMFGLEIAILFAGTRIINIIFQIFPQYAHYIGSKYGGSGGGYTLLLFFHLILLCGLILNSGKKQFVMESNINYYIRRYGIKTNIGVDNIYLFSIMFAILLTALAHTFSVMARANSLFLTFIIVYVPNLLSKMLDRKDRVIVKVIGTVLLVIYFYFSTVSDSRLSPFTFYWM